MTKQREWNPTAFRAALGRDARYRGKFAPFHRALVAEFGEGPESRLCSRYLMQVRLQDGSGIADPIVESWIAKHLGIPLRELYR